MIKRKAKQWIILAVLFFIVTLIETSLAAGTLNERDYKKLESIHRLIEKNQLNQAEKQLNQFLSKKHKAYTQAIFLQTAAHVALEKTHYDKAITYLEQADSLKALPQFVSSNILYNLTQLYFQKAMESQSSGKKYLKKSVHLLERWLAGQTSISSEQRIFAATVYGRNKQYKSAVSQARQAIKQSKKKAPEAWYQLLISLYLEQKHYNQAIEVYKKLIKLYPNKKNYWKQLSTLYLQTDKIHQALAVMTLAEKQGLLSTEQELLRLANLYLYANIPLSAAKVLKKNIKSGLIQPSIKNRLKLVDALTMAQDYTQATKTLLQLAQIEKKNGQYHYRAGRLLMEQAKWSDAFLQFKEAEGKKLVDHGHNYLLQGISAYYAKNIVKAKKSFQKSIKYKKYEKKSELWLEQLDFYTN